MTSFSSSKTILVAVFIFAVVYASEPEKESKIEESKSVASEDKGKRSILDRSYNIIFS